MKKYLSFLCMAFLAVVFYSCEDVPAPYEINNQGGSDNTIYKETFASSLGKWKNIVIAGEGGWKNDYSTACATGYDKTTGKTTPVTAYLVSPTISLEGVDTAHITYDYVLRYNKGNENQQIFIIDDSEYDITKSPADLVWTLLNNNHEETVDYNTFVSIAADIPTKFMGKKVRFAFFYNCPDNGSTWEVKNFKVLKGEADIPGPGPSGECIIPYSSTNLKDGFTVQTEVGTAWSLGNSYAKASGYNNGTTEATKTWLISPAINTSVTGDDAVIMNFDYVLRYVSAATDLKNFHKVLVSTDYAGDATTATWTQLGYEPKESATRDWTFYASNSITVPNEFLNKEKVYFAFYFECTAEGSTTWELQNLTIQQGTAPTPPTPVGDNLITNGNFESWSGNTPTNWQSASSASSATLKQSSDAHSGSYAVSVEGTTSGNKRIAYKEITLKPGTYYVQFYAKGDGAEASVCPGYVPVNNGVADSQGYKYGSYTNNISASEWVEVNHEFTLTSQTTLCLVIMNPKKLGTSVLIDDFSLKTSDGGIAEGGDTPPTPPTPTDVKTATIAEFIAAAVSSSQYYQLTGKVSGLKSGDKYGNFDLTDATGTVYVYGLLSEQGGAKQKFQELVAAKGITDGCTLTLIGKRGEYQGKVEVVDAYFVSCEGGDTPPTPPTPSGGIKLSEFTNSGFENWTDDKTPAQWKSTTTASNATISKSTDAHGGNYSVLVEGNTSANKRLGSTEILLEAGEYTISFYAKGASGSSAASVRPGYVPVTDGKVGSYVYGNYTNDITDFEWIKVTHTFSLTSATTVNLVIMNPKNCGNLLIDDYTITKD